MNEVDLELFQAGRWAGWEFSTTDLDRIIANAEKVAPYITPRLILGHSKRSEQPELGRMEQPCIGQLKPGSLRRMGKKLLGTFSHVPDIVQRAMAENLYPSTSVSIECYPDFRDTRTARDLERNVPGFKAPSGPVLCAAAVLGSSSLPAVKTLSDLRAYLGENEPRTVVAASTLDDRLKALEARYAAMMEQRSATLARLAKLNARRATFATPGQEGIMTTTRTTKNFRAQVDDAIAASGGDATDAQTRLDTARQLYPATSRTSARKCRTRRPTSMRSSRS